MNISADPPKLNGFTITIERTENPLPLNMEKKKLSEINIQYL